MTKSLLEKEEQSYNNFPREVTSLCPECGNKIKAIIRIQGNTVVMEKTCQKHGFFQEILSTDKNFYLRMEKLSFGDGPGILNPATQRQLGCPFDCGLCNEHKSTTMMGVIDLTNRCNLKCPICFATSDASGYIYEPTFEQVKQMMLNLYNLKPAHTPCIQFSGGEPTLHPRFFDILKEARNIGFTQIQIATNGIIFASSEEFAKKASQAGLNILYLQFDGVTDDIYIKTRGKPLMEIKKKAIANAFKYGIRTILVPTVVKGVNDHQVGDIYRFALDNIDAVLAISWQPIALTGRIDETEKEKMRYTLTDLARDTEKQFPHIKMQDWYPIAVVSPFSRFLEVVTGEHLSQLSCHSHCGTATYLVVDKEHNQFIPLPRFVDVIGLLTKMQEIYQQHQHKKYFKNIRAKLNILNYSRQFEEFYDQEKAPDNMPFKEFFSYLKEFTNRNAFIDNLLKRKILKKRKWKLLIIEGMHFQDSYNYEAERTKRCVVHYSAPDGKLYPFCTYNAGPYFREKVEKQFARKIK